MGYTLTLAERETTIRWDAEEKVAHIYTSDPIYMRKLDKLCEEHPEEYLEIWHDAYSKKYIGPAKLIRFGKPASEARREANRRNARFLPKSLANMAEPSSSNALDE